MDFDVIGSLAIAFRWLHLITGIAWIGASFYFVWLDMNLETAKKEEDRKDGVTGELWSVHGGGFYHKQKYAVAPPKMPEHLHWFKWEAYTTWLSGIALMIVIYYIGASAYLIDPAKWAAAPIEAIGASITGLIAGWLFYDLLCRSPLGRNVRIFGPIWFAFLIGAAWFYGTLFTDKAAFIQIGAMIGTAMVGNVFFVIIPNQRKVVDALEAGNEPDPSLGAAGKQRSLHNNYMTLPVLFIMVSGHFPKIVGFEQAWAALAAISVVGILTRHFFNLKNQGKIAPAYLAVAGTLFIVTMIAVQPSPKAKQVTTADRAAPAFHKVQALMATHCTQCHAKSPAHEYFEEAPGNVMLTTPALIKRYAPQIKAQVVDTDIMPLGNETGMTEAERTLIADWIAAGAVTGEE